MILPLDGRDEHEERPIGPVSMSMVMGRAGDMITRGNCTKG
jgi:hypothetical protein